MQLQIVTLAVRSLAQSKAFYEDVLGFEPDIYYEPTRWGAYKFVIRDPDGFRLGFLGQRERRLQA